AHIRVFQFRCPRLRHPFKAEFGDAVGAPAWVTDLAGVAGYVDDRTAALNHRRQGVLLSAKMGRSNLYRGLRGNLRPDNRAGSASATAQWWRRCSRARRDGL